jgi:hypothetical protein
MFNAASFFDVSHGLSVGTEAKNDERVGAAATVSTHARAEQPLTHRWLDLETFAHGQRYRSAAHSGGDHFIENAQERTWAVGHFKLDAEDRYAIGFRASSGHYFNWAYADIYGNSFTKIILNTAAVKATYTPAEWIERTAAALADPTHKAIIRGLQSAGWQMYPRELYFRATPVDAVTIEVGSIGIERGYSTEITTFDNDGYVTGERISVHVPKLLFFDHIGYTNAFFGEIGTPNFLDRTDNMNPKNTNYRQVFANKRINARLGASGEYTYQLGTHALREGLLVDTKEWRFVKSLRAEAYQRLNAVSFQGATAQGGAGFALIADTEVLKRFTVNMGYAQIDKNNSSYGGSRYFHSVGFGLNSDSFSEGRRMFVQGQLKLSRTLSAVGTYTHVVGPYVLTYDQENITGGMELNLKALINSKKEIF